MGYNAEEEFQLQWIANHRMEDKDALTTDFLEKSAKRVRAERVLIEYNGMWRSPSAWELPMPEDEIDLHGFTADEAAEAVERRIDDLLIAGLSVLRVIHGGGNPEYGNVKHIIDRKVRSEWKNKVVFYKVEPDNAGSSIMKIGKPRPSVAKKAKN